MNGPTKFSLPTTAGVYGPAGVPPTPDYDNRHLPRFLFLGAAVLTMGMFLAILKPLARVRREERMAGAGEAQ